MKLLERNLGPITNQEVQAALERRGASRDWSKQKVSTSERQAYGYLSAHCPKSLTREELQAFFDALQEFKLTRGEKLQLANLHPTVPVDMHMIVSKCEERLTDEQIEQLIAVVQQHLF